MESNIKGLVAAGHEMASELKAECGAVDMRSVAKLISDLATQLEVQLVRANALAEDQQKAIESINQADAAVKLAHEKFSALARIVLASLEADPVAYIFKHPAGKLFWALTDESNKEQSDVIPVYAAPPVPVVPEEKPMPNPLKMYAVDAVAAIAEVRGWNACRAAMLQAEPVSNSDELPLDYLQGHKDGLEWAAQLAEANHPQTGDWLYDDPIDLARAIRKGPDMPTVQAGNYPVTPSEVLSAIREVAKIRADFDDFDGDRRGIGDCLDEVEQELIVTINKYASQLAAEPIAPNDVREQTAIPQVPVTQDGWISCSEQMPAQDDWILIYSKHGEYMAGQVQGEYVELSDGTLSWLGNALYWMPLPEPPQEVN